ncbi:hypothetical protein BH23GEM8_BH23GEM8_11030 [soil metagenome]
MMLGNWKAAVADNLRVPSGFSQAVRTAHQMRNVLDTPEAPCLKVSNNEVFSNTNILGTPYSN